MSCDNCEAVQERGDVAYLRIDKANVGLIGCDEHLNKLASQMRQKEVNQVWVRVLGKASKEETIRDFVAGVRESIMKSTPTEIAELNEAFLEGLEKYVDLYLLSKN